MHIEKNRFYSGWWTLYSDDDKPIISSTWHQRVQSYYDGILKELRDKQLLDLQCFAEDIRPLKRSFTE